MLWGKHILRGLFAIATLAAFAALLVLSACSSKSEGTAKQDGVSNDGIIGGVDVPENNAIVKGVVAVYDSYSSQLCTGSLLQNNTVLTAAHCLGGDVSNMFIIFGTKITGDSERRQADKMEASLEWQEQIARNITPLTGDIGLIHFKGSIPAGFEAANFLTDAKVLKKGGRVILAGYGIDDGTAKTGAGTLRATNVLIDDPQFNPFEVKLDQRKGQGACHGDSGGPAYIYKGGNYFLWGVTSRGAEDADDNCTQFGIYTNALGYLDWIQATIAKFSGPPRASASSAQAAR